MRFSELVQRVQMYSGLPSEESRDALELMVESLAVHLPEPERRHFASELPEELSDLALSVWPTEYTASQDIVEQFMEQEHIDEGLARQQIRAAWTALKDVVSEGQLNSIRALLPRKSMAWLS